MLNGLSGISCLSVVEEGLCHYLELLVGITIRSYHL